MTTISEAVKGRKALLGGVMVFPPSILFIEN